MSFVQDNQFKISSFNVNSIRMRLPLLLEFLEYAQPDIMCLQETKIEHIEQVREPLGDLGYDIVHSGQKTFNGVAVLYRGRASDTVVGVASLALPLVQQMQLNEQKRLVALAVESDKIKRIFGVNQLFVASVYVPNGEHISSDKFTYKLQWLNQLQCFAQNYLKQYAHFVLAGDFNIAPTDLDVYAPELWKEQVLCTTQERQLFNELLETGFVDVKQKLHKGSVDYTFWDYRQASFAKNHGLRIDHVLVSQFLAPYCVDFKVERAFRGHDKPSDHAPVSVVLTAVNAIHVNHDSS